MRKIAFSLATVAVILSGLLGFFSIARGQVPASMGDEGGQVLVSEVEGMNRRTIYAPAGEPAPNAPNIGFIDSPTVACYQPDPGQDACYINWYYLQVNASPNYMIAMTVTLNTIGPVARYGGFFQTSMYVPFNMHDRGFKVACGALGAGGQANLGNAYAWTINARDSSNLKAANYGTAYCPAYTP